MICKELFEKIESTQINSPNDIEVLIDLFKSRQRAQNNRINLDRVSFAESLKLKFSLFLQSNSNVTITDFLRHLHQSDSDIKFLYTEYKSLKSEAVEKENLSEALRSVGYFFGKHDDFFAGRTEELKYMHLTLKRKLKNNLLIIGEPGTGKTSLVKEYSLVSGKDIFVIEMNNVISGTKYRGEFEQKLTKVLDYSQKNDIMLFIDEIHVVLGAGNSEGGLSGADILKPYITNPSIKVIGATTLEEYKLIENDRALERRFNILKLDPPTRRDIFQIYNNLLSFLQIEGLSEKEFDVIYDTLLQNSDRQFPDKLVDFLDLYQSVEKNEESVCIDKVLGMIIGHDY